MSDGCVKGRSLISSVPLTAIFDIVILCGHIRHEITALYDTEFSASCFPLTSTSMSLMRFFFSSLTWNDLESETAVIKRFNFLFCSSYQCLSVSLFSEDFGFDCTVPRNCYFPRNPMVLSQST